jgi:hypothetical protein
MVILYKMFHRVPVPGHSPRRVVHGYIVAKPGEGYNNDKLLRKFVTGPTYKSEEIINSVTLVITNGVAAETMEVTHAGQ